MWESENDLDARKNADYTMSSNFTQQNIWLYRSLSRVTGTVNAPVRQTDEENKFCRCVLIFSTPPWFQLGLSKKYILFTVDEENGIGVFLIVNRLSNI